MTHLALDSVPLVEHAIAYAALGWPVFPIYEPNGSECSCSKRDQCYETAKHPRVEGGLNSASTDPTQIKSWWRKWPDANIGIRTGNGRYVIDVDPGNGGNEGLADVLAEYSELPDTLESITGSGGRHIFFSYDQEIRNSVQLIAPGVDVRGDGGYIVAPPSRHASGGTYEWKNYGHPITRLPDWIYNLLQKKRERRGPLPPLPDKILSGARNETLFRHACKMRNQGLEYADILAAIQSVNSTRCVPPLDAAAVHTIAKQAAKYPPGAATPMVVAGKVIEHDEKWKQGLTYTDRGKLVTIAGNVSLYLQHHPSWRDSLFYDQFSGKYFWIGALPKMPGSDPPAIGEAEDHHYSYVQHWFSYNQETGVKIPVQDICHGITLAARRNSRHPVRDYLNGVVHDGIPRVGRWLSTYLGVADTPYSRLVGRWWLISAVARIMKPGCKVDSMLIFEGVQGAGKSTAINVLAGEWFTDTPIPLGDKDAYAQIRGMWVVELAELSALKGAGNHRAKSFFSSRVDRFRPAFERATRDFPRQCVFIGSVNEDEYLHDPTGGRRYWPVYCGNIDIAALRRDRDQLWAEAVELFEAGERYWPETADEAAICKAEQEKRYVTDAWEDQIERYLSTVQDVTVGDVLVYLGISKDKWDSASQNRVASCLKRLGWERHIQWIPGGSSKRVYRRKVKP